MAVEGPVVFIRAHSMIVYRHSLGETRGPIKYTKKLAEGRGQKMGRSLKFGCYGVHMDLLFLQKSLEWRKRP